MARQFDIFRLRSGPCVIVIQSDLLDAMRTRVVAPLLPIGQAGPAMRALNPTVDIDGATYMLMPQLLATLDTQELGEAIGNASDQRDEIVRALDALLSGL